MKMTAPTNTATLAPQTTNTTAPEAKFNRLPQQQPAAEEAASAPAHRTGCTEEDLKNRIFAEGNGKGLMKFCRELSVILIRNYRVDGEMTELRERLGSSLQTTLDCDEKQAMSLIELSLELIHAKVHGAYRRNEVDLSYLISTAVGAVGDVSSN